MDLGIAGKVALVTGSARSLGKADAVMLAAEGCKVAIVDLNAEGAEETARELAASGARPGATRATSADYAPGAGHGRARSSGSWDPVDICVNNAGMIYTVGQLKDMRDEDWEFNLGVNLTGTMKVTRAVFPGMRERRWGRIVCMASIAGLMGGFGQTAYSTSKIGIIGFAKSVALEGARYNVTCNAVAPGIVAPNASLSPLYERMVKRVAMQREGRARGRGLGDRVPLLRARPLHHRRGPDGHRRNGSVHVLDTVLTRRTPMPTVKETFEAMAGRFRADKASGTTAVIQYDVSGDGGGTWHAVIKDGACTVNSGSAPNPNLTLSDRRSGLARHAVGQAVGADALHVRQAQGEGRHGPGHEAGVDVLDVDPAPDDRDCACRGAAES